MVLRDGPTDLRAQSCSRLEAPSTSSLRSLGLTAQPAGRSKVHSSTGTLTRRFLSLSRRECHFRVVVEASAQVETPAATGSKHLFLAESFPRPCLTTIPSQPQLFEAAPTQLYLDPQTSGYGSFSSNPLSKISKRLHVLQKHQRSRVH